MAKEQFKSVRGMSDVLPDQRSNYDQVVSTFMQLATEANYGKIDTPLLEDEALFVRSVGEGTDVVDKEIYAFTDRSENRLALRPEGTAGVMRAYLEHGLGSWPQPVRLFYTGAMFRYDRPQAGRYRQHTQLGVEVIGDPNPSADAGVILLADRLFRRLGLHMVSLQINSIGDAACRPKYFKALKDYFEEHKQTLSETSRERLKANPLRILDSKEEGDIAVSSGAPQILNYLCKSCQAHLTGVLEYLDDLGLSYELNPHLVRGLDYYTRTVFEFQGTREGAQSSLGGGGRYDGLIEALGGSATPAVGFGLGVERIALELEKLGISRPITPAVRVFVASLGEPARLTAFRVIEQLLDGGVGAAGAVDKNGIQNQLARADRLGLPYAIIIGQKEVMDKTIILRDMGSGAQEVIPMDRVVSELQHRFHIAPSAS